MMRYAVPVLAAAGSAVAASNTCSFSTTATVQNVGDASAIAACTTYTGDIAIATNAVGELDFNQPLVRINGDITVMNAPNLTSLTGDSLQTVDGTWTLNNVQTLNTLNFPQLSAVGAIDWEGLPNLNSFMFTSEIQNTSSFNLQNTAVSSLDGLNFKKASGFTLANNNFLQAFSMQLQNVDGSILVQSNGNRMNVSFPNLQWAQNITIDNVPSISMPSLYAVNGSISFVANEELTTLSFPNLTRVDESFTINSNEQLKSFSVPKLTTVHGAVNVQNNSVLSNITFPSLTEVGGAFDAYGNFSGVSLPKITDVHGTFNVQSTKDISDSCDVFDNEHGANSVLKGDGYKCNGLEASPTSNPNGGGSGSSGSSGSDNKGAASSVRVPVFEITAVLGAIGALFML